MTLVGTGGSKLAQLVTNHVLGDIHRNMLAAVVYREGMTDELREDREARDQVLRTFFSPFSFISTTLLISSGATKGPFLTLLPILR